MPDVSPANNHLIKRVKSKKFLLSAIVFVAICSALIGVYVTRTSSAANPNLKGDIDSNNVVDYTDLSILLTQYGQNNTSADLNADTKVDIFDLSILLSNYGKTYSPTSPMPAGVSGNWTLKFSDDFNGTTLDTSKWVPSWFGGNTGITKPVNDTYEESCYDPSNVSVGGGVVNIAAQTRSCRATNNKTYNYASGIINSYGKYNFTYGVMEARVWIPPGTGRGQNWPAFWTNGENWPTTGEIDVVEVLGGEMCYHFHYDGGAPGGCASTTATAGWHTFSAKWQPGSITYYYDGQQVGQITQGVTSAPMYLIINFGLSSQLSPPIVTPSNMQVDYVRVWQ